MVKTKKAKKTPPEVTEKKKKMIDAYLHRQASLSEREAPKHFYRNQERYRRLFGARLTSARLSVPLTQEESALLLGVTNNTYARWENSGSTPGFEMILKIIKVMKCSADFLLGVDMLDILLDEKMEFVKDSPEQRLAARINPALDPLNNKTIAGKKNKET